MGVPAFFRWLSRKYPSIVTNCVEDKPREINGVTVPVDTTGPNPNGVEFDNLYLDMNGIVHPCTHPEDRPAPKNEAEMMVAIFDSIDRLFRIVRPRRLLYMAVDGVAPRAKMNQQRSRRFRAAKDAREKREDIERMRQELDAQGIPLPPAKAAEEHFDSNCITPGTPFMARLSDCLRYYIHDRLTNDPGWKNLMVILSDANVPGEGEHKIMDFIRRQRASPGHDPNTQHVLCGADADLIMLGLATHEPYFTIIREEFVPNQQRPCELCGQFGHELRQCQGLAKIKSGEYDEIADPIQREKNYIFIRLTVLREYLERDLHMPNLPFQYDFERAIDDWVFMCFFVGNDFLPHLPSLEIREGAIDRLIKLYKSCVYKTKGFLTENGLVNLQRVQLILKDLGEVEDEIFRDRQQNEVERKAKEKQRRKRMKAQSQSMPSFFPSNDYYPKALDTREKLSGSNVRNSAYDGRVNYMKQQQDNVDAAKKLKSLLSEPDLMKAGFNGTLSVEKSTSSDNRGQKRKRENNSDDEEPEVVDDVRLWETGWKERYYQAKFEVSADDTVFRYRVAHAYVEGLCWVLRYYYQGCCSWVWYFPYHYAPFASDFLDLQKLNIKFDPDTKSIRPLEQLMSVFPAASRRHVPEPWGKLMLDVESPIIDFYPSDFKVDLNGKKFAWQGVALLPFVDARRLDEALQHVYPLLTDEEKRRNVVGEDRFFVHVAHPVYSFLSQLYESQSAEWTQMDGKLTHGVSGLLKKDECGTLPNNIVISPIDLCPNLPKNNAISVEFRDPQFPKNYVFPAKRLKGVKEPAPTLKPQDWDDSKGRYYPQIGFSRDVPRASLSDPAKRFLKAGLRADFRTPYPPRYESSMMTSSSYASYEYYGVSASPYPEMHMSPYRPPRPQHQPSYGTDRRTARLDYPQPYPQQQQQRSSYRDAHGSSSLLAGMDPRGGSAAYRQDYTANQYWANPVGGPPAMTSSRQPTPNQQRSGSRAPPTFYQQPGRPGTGGRPSAADYF